MLPAFAWRPIAALATSFSLLLIATSAGYGYHRDELYFIAIGGHPAFGYVDQPPFVPLLAHGLDAAFGHSLVMLRLPSAIAGGLVLLVTALIAREFGGGRGEQILAAAAMASTGVLFGASHLMSPTTFDILGWAVVLWLVVRALRDGGRTWVLVGLAAGASLEIKTLPIFLFASLLAAVLIVGPRSMLGSRWLWAGTAIAIALWAPNLIWQAAHGWPQLTLSRSIAAGHSGSSQPRALFVPFQFLLFTPPLSPMWIAGLWRLWRTAQLATWRCIPVAYVLLTVLFIATGGKPYYLAGIYPVLFAAGATPALHWARSVQRRRTLATVIAVSAGISAVAALPIVPARWLHNTPVLAINYDAGEQVGWPRFAATVADAYDRVPSTEGAHAIVLTGNYGEAGAMLRYRPRIPTYSGHNSLWDLGPPPASTTTVIAIGYGEHDLRRWFAQVVRVATIDNGVDLDNDEQGAAVWLCTGPTEPWPQLWHEMKRLG